MKSRTIYRLHDIIDAIEQIDLLLAERTFEDMQADRILRAAFERFLEILSEASRHIPSEMKQQAPEMPWPRIADIGNHIRHAYHRVDAEILWNLHADGHLAELKQVTAKFVAELEKQRDA